MASDSKRAVLIFAGVAAVAAAAGLYFFKVMRPAQMRGEAQEEIKAWETKWLAARECLLGASPVSSKTSEALAIREMQTEVTPHRGCTDEIGKLTRDAGADSGMPDVELAWAALEKAAAKTANAFATHIGSSTTVEDPLPAALDALDAARVALRASAQMVTVDLGGKALPVAQLVPIADGADPVESIDQVDLMPSAHGMVASAVGKHSRLQITFVTGGAPRIEHDAGSLMRSTADGSFAAQPTDTAIEFGAAEADGTIAKPTSLPVAKPTLSLVGGTLADGVLVFATIAPPDLKGYIAHVKAGQATVDAPFAFGELAVAADTDGRIAIVTGKDDSGSAQLLAPGAAPQVIDLGRKVSGVPCFTRDRLWVSTAATGEVSFRDGKPAQAAIGFGGGKPVYQFPANAQLLGCTADAALFESVDDPEVVDAPPRALLCTETCRVVNPISGAPSAAVLSVVGGKLVAIAEHGGVLAVWREAGSPLYYALPAPAHPVLAHEWGAMAMSDGKVLDILARGAKTFSIIRIPATATPAN